MFISIRDVVLVAVLRDHLAVLRDHLAQLTGQGTGKMTDQVTEKMAEGEIAAKGILTYRTHFSMMKGKFQDFWFTFHHPLPSKSG